MTYESTGEVRPPEEGEYYINKYGGEVGLSVVQAIGPPLSRPARVIMRPVREEKQPVAYHIVIPFYFKERAEEELKTLFDRTMLIGHIEEIYE